MSKTRLIVTSLLGAYALSLAFAAAASAAEPVWWVEGAPLKGEEKVVAKATSALVVETKNRKIECTSFAMEPGVLGEGNNNSGTAVLGGCVVPAEPTKCEIASSLKSEPLLFPLENVGGVIKLKFKPKTGEVILVVNVKNKGVETCESKGKFELKSKEKAGMICEYPSVETEKLEHLLDFTKLSGSEITFAGESAVFTANITFTLASGKKWSAK
jgi:hypothetical protein